MEPVLGSTDQLDDSQSPVVGRGMRVLLECPHCQSSGWVLWEHLQRGLRCRECNQRFHLAADGRFHSTPQIRRLRYRCPRCRHSSSIGASQALSGAECPACNLMLFSGPNQQVYDAQELAAAKRTARAASWAAHLQKRAQRTFTRNGSLHWPAVTVAGIVAIVLVVFAASFVSSTRSNTLEDRCIAFTKDCLRGEDEETDRYVIDDIHQQMELKRWRIMHFASIQDRHRPGNDRVSFQATTVADEGARRIVRITMTSPFMGSRVVTQHWAGVGELWHFDAVASLAGQGAAMALQPVAAE